MKPETAAFLAKSRECLAKADVMLAHWPDEAGRAAYLAGLHAAQALIVEKTGQVVKAHKGVQRELGGHSRKIASPCGYRSPCHCEEPLGDEAIQG